MCKDVSTLYAREQNKKCGRHGYHFCFREKETVIPVDKYGVFVLNKKRNK